MDPLERLKTLLDPDRLVVAGVIGIAPRSIDDIARASELDRSRVLEAVAALRTAGLVKSDELTYGLDLAGLRSIAADLADHDIPMDPTIGFGMTDEEQAILSRFFEGRTLASVPTSRAKRLVVLERLALEFDVGKKYPEEAVNSLLGAFHPDWSTLRRHLVDEGLLDREQNVYWRSGGRVPGVYRG